MKKSFPCWQPARYSLSACQYPQQMLLQRILPCCKTRLSNRLTRIHSISFQNEPMFLRKKYKLAMSTFQPKFTSRATPTQPNKSPGHAFAIRAIPAAFISPTAATFSAQRICTSNPTVAVLSSQNMRCRPASGKLPLPALTPLTAVHR